MTDLIKNLVSIDATPGNEEILRKFIISEIEPYCEFKTDALGNIIATKKGKITPNKKIMLDAHMDEVGFIITHITEDGFLRFTALGGIDVSAMLFKTVRINGKINGVISGEPIHLTSKDEDKKLPDEKDLYIDIGAKDKTSAESLVSVGDRAVMVSDFTVCGKKIISKALDDRIGCAILIKLIKEYDEYDFTAVFSVQEEIGLRGAKTAVFSVEPYAAIVLEGTTAADVAGVPTDKSVCNLGKGVAVSFMDRATVYDREYYNAAIKSGIKVQPKRAVAGGNNSGTIHLSKSGVRTIALSVPCRYIHSSSSVADTDDINSAYSLAEYMIGYIANDN